MQISWCILHIKHFMYETLLFRRPIPPHAIACNEFFMLPLMGNRGRVIMQAQPVGQNIISGLTQISSSNYKKYYFTPIHIKISMKKENVSKYFHIIKYIETPCEALPTRLIA